MTRLGKILVVLIAFASLAFAGFAIVVFYAGPNWQEMASHIDGYKFSLSAGENPTWSAVQARGDQQVSTDKNLAKVIDAVLAHKLKQLKDETADFEGRIPSLTEQLDKSKVANTEDVPALLEYVTAQQKRLDDLNAEIAKLEADVLTKTADAQKIENIAADRREDVFRLGGQLTEIRADQFRLKAIHRQLSEELQQVNGYLERAEQRQAQIQSSTESQEIQSPGESADL